LVLLAGGEDEAGGVLQVFVLQLFARASDLWGELDGLVNVIQLASALVHDHAGNVHFGCGLGVDSVQRNFVAGNGDRDRDVVAALLEAEVAVGEVDVEGVVGDVGVEFVHQLLAAIGGVEVVDVAAGVVAGAGGDGDAGAGDLDLDLAVLAVLGVVGTTVADEVVGASVGLHLGVDGSEVVGFEEGLAAGVV